MTNILHLGPVPGNRRVGLTAEKPFQGHLLIHGTPKELDVVTHGAPNQLDVTVHGTQKPIDVVMHDTQKPIDVVMHGAQKDLENVSHTPLSSSDDALSDEDPDGLAFSSKNSRASVGASTETLDRERRNLSGSPRPELGVDKSNILPTQFLTTTRRSVSPDDQIFKRPLWVPDDSTVEEWGRKKPKTKNHYGQNGKSFHMPKITRNYSRAGKTKSQPEDNESLLSLSDEDFPAQESKKGAFVAPRKLDSSRAQRACQSSQGSGQATANTGFKIPKHAPVREINHKSETAGNFKSPPLLIRDVASPRATRPKKTFKKPETVVTEGIRGDGDIIDLATTTRPKSDLLDLNSAVPSSSITASSVSNDKVSASSSPISSPPSSPDLDASFIEISSITANPVFYHPKITTQCPYCKQRVDRDLLLDYDSTVRLSVGEQIRFCKAHRIRCAEVEWKEKGYPTIDWANFDERLAKFHPHLDNILENKRESFYRNAYEERLKSRQNETGEQSVENSEMGYYGSRGAVSIMQNIITRFDAKLRHLSTKDKLISSISVSSYVQVVLAPEMAVMLVKEDMGVDDEAARALLKESAALGNLLNEEEDQEI